MFTSQCSYLLPNFLPNFLNTVSASVFCPELNFLCVGTLSGYVLVFALKNTATLELTTILPPPQLSGSFSLPPDLPVTHLYTSTDVHSVFLTICYRNRILYFYNLSVGLPISHIDTNLNIYKISKCGSNIVCLFHNGRMDAFEPCQSNLIKTVTVLTSNPSSMTEFDQKSVLIAKTDGLLSTVTVFDGSVSPVCHDVMVNKIQEIGTIIKASVLRCSTNIIVVMTSSHFLILGTTPSTLLFKKKFSDISTGFLEMSGFFIKDLEIFFYGPYGYCLVSIAELAPLVLTRKSTNNFKQSELVSFLQSPIFYSNNMLSSCQLDDSFTDQLHFPDPGQLLVYPCSKHCSKSSNQFVFNFPVSHIFTNRQSFFPSSDCFLQRIDGSLNFFFVSNSQVFCLCLALPQCHYMCRVARQVDQTSKLSDLLFFHTLSDSLSVDSAFGNFHEQISLPEKFVDMYVLESTSSYQSNLIVLLSECGLFLHSLCSHGSEFLANIILPNEFSGKSVVKVENNHKIDCFLIVISTSVNVVLTYTFDTKTRMLSPYVLLPLSGTNDYSISSLTWSSNSVTLKGFDWTRHQSLDVHYNIQFFEPKYLGFFICTVDFLSPSNPKQTINENFPIKISCLDYFDPITCSHHVIGSLVHFDFLSVNYLNAESPGHLLTRILSSQMVFPSFSLAKESCSYHVIVTSSGSPDGNQELVPVFPSLPPLKLRNLSSLTQFPVISVLHSLFILSVTLRQLNCNQPDKFTHFGTYSAQLSDCLLFPLSLLGHFYETYEDSVRTSTRVVIEHVMNSLTTSQECDGLAIINDWINCLPKNSAESQTPKPIFRLDSVIISTFILNSKIRTPFHDHFVPLLPCLAEIFSKMIDSSDLAVLILTADLILINPSVLVSHSQVIFQCFQKYFDILVYNSNVTTSQSDLCYKFLSILSATFSSVSLSFIQSVFAELEFKLENNNSDALNKTLVILQLLKKLLKTNKAAFRIGLEQILTSLIGVNRVLEKCPHTSRQVTDNLTRELLAFFQDLSTTFNFIASCRSICAVGDSNGTITCFYLSQAKKPLKFKGHRRGITCLEFDDSAQFLYSFSRFDGFIKSWAFNKAPSGFFSKPKSVAVRVPNVSDLAKYVLKVECSRVLLVDQRDDSVVGLLELLS
ncbi:hypothetical protein RCL1_001702 [Eukaryota sp. TZLM3-RCL]